ncbi:MAG: hypothetical protein IPG59_01080 [Candidatus Melainabacteria bacterium]|nr:MAG: hypothetical protein IPG59_01080 [Candidatus Melainabacteria bacterium]
MKRSIISKPVQIILIASLAFTAQSQFSIPAFCASKSKKYAPAPTLAPSLNKSPLEGTQTPQLDQSANLPVEPVPDSNVNSNERTFFPPPQLNDNYVAPNQMPAQIQNQNQTMPNLLQGGVESSATLQLQQPPPPVYNNNININRNMMPPPNYMQGQVMSFQNQMQRMQGQLAPLVQQQPLQGYQQYQQPTQFNLRIDRPNWIPPNAYTNDTMLAPYHNSNLFFWDKRGMPNRPQMVQLANSVTKYWHGFVPNPCFVLVEPLPAAPGNYVFTSQDRRAPRGWLQNTGQNSVSGFPMYRYWLDNPF